MNVKKLISSVSALAIAASAFAGLAVSASAEATKVVDEALTATPTSTDAYTWGTDLNVSANGLLLTNGNSKGNNYENKDVLTFVNAIGDSSTGVTISYHVGPQGSNASKGQAYTYLTLSFLDSSDNAIFGITEGIGNWSNTSTIAYGDKTANIGNHIVAGGSDVSASLKFNSTGGTVTVGDNAYAFTASSGIKKIVASVTGEQDYSRGVYIKNLQIATEEITEQTALVTVKSYDKADSSVIRETSTEAVVGTTYEATDAQKATFTADNGKKYIFDEAASTTSAVVGETGAEISLVFNEASKYTYTVKAVGDIEKDIASEQIYDGDSKTIYFPRYILEGTTIYETPAKAGTYYGVTVSEAGSEELTYTKAYENVVLFDDLDNTASNNANVRASNGLARDNAAYESAEIPAGEYKVVVRYESMNRGSTITLGDTTIVDFAQEARGAWTDKTVDVTLTEPAKLIHNVGGNNSRDDLDTIIIYSVQAQPTKYTITLDYADGTDPVTTEVEANDTFTFPTPDDRPGAEFGGWKLNWLGGEDVIVNGGETMMVTGDAAYTAVWTENVVEPTVHVEKIGVFTEDTGNPAAAFKGSVTAGTYAISTLRWVAYTDENNLTDVDLAVNIASGSTVVTGLVVEAANVDVNAIGAGVGPVDSLNVILD